VQYASRILAFESCLLLLEVFKVGVMEILWQLAFYAMIDWPETTMQQEQIKREQSIEKF
jgi:hypothetical protein